MRRTRRSWRRSFDQIRRLRVSRDRREHSRHLVLDGGTRSPSRRATILEQSRSQSPESAASVNARRRRSRRCFRSRWRTRSGDCQVTTRRCCSPCSTVVSGAPSPPPALGRRPPTVQTESSNEAQSHLPSGDQAKEAVSRGLKTLVNKGRVRPVDTWVAQIPASSSQVKDAIRLPSGDQAGQQSFDGVPPGKTFGLVPSA